MIVTHRDVIGYIPNDELDWNSSRIVDRSAYRPGMQVEALVLRADAASGELVFSRKELLEDPWPAYPHREGDTTEGTVAAVLPNGNLLVNADGIVGEVLKYNVSWFNFQSGMNRYRTGDRLRVLLVKFDPEARVLFLSGTGGAESPWNGVNYRVGSKYEVTVLRTDRMAVMVALDGIIGEIPRERIGWITPPSAEGAFAEGERIEAQLIFINRTKRVAQFSRKAVLPDPWSVPIAEGDVAEAKVVEARRQRCVSMSGAGWASAPAKRPHVRRRSLRRRAARRALPPGRATPRTHRGHRPPQPAPLRRFARPGGLPPDGRPTIRHHRPRPGTGRVRVETRRRHPRHALLRTRHMECAGNLAPRTRRASGGAGRGLRFQTRLPAVRPSHPDSRSVEIAPYRPRILHRNAARRLRRRIGHRALRRNRPVAFAPRHGDPRRKAVAGVRRSRRAAGRRPVSGFMSPGSTPESAGC